MSRWLNSFIFYLFPDWQLYATPWMRIWRENQKQAYFPMARFALLVFIVAYLGHLFFIDRPLGLTDVKWIWYRAGVSGIAALCILHSYFPTKSLDPLSYKWPVVALGVITSYMQTLSMTWYPEIPYLWGIAIPIVFASILRLNTFSSLFFCGFIYVLQFKHYIASGVSPTITVEASVTGLFILAMMKRHLMTDVLNFIQQQGNIDVERRLVESKKELSDQIQGFLPKVINERIVKNIEQQKMSVIQAVDDELRPKQRNIACLFSDIRSYTQLSKDEGFIYNSVLPDTHEAVSIVESYGGIPRTIGDLVFSYFDGPKVLDNVILSILSGHEISEATQLRNKGREESLVIKRYLIITAGQAIVGNVGGAGSSREVTALGTCVNKAARMDELTKQPRVQKEISTSGVLVDEDVYMLMGELLDHVEIKKVEPMQLKVAIRDFDENEIFWFIPFSPNLIDSLKRFIQSNENNTNSNKRQVA